MKNKFDELIKKAALEHVEPFKPEYWDTFEKKLNTQANSGANKGIKWMKIAAGAAILTASVALVYISNSESAPQQVQDKFENNSNIEQKLHDNNVLIDEYNSSTNNKKEAKEAMELKINTEDSEKTKNTKPENIKNIPAIAEAKINSIKEEKEPLIVKQESKTDVSLPVDNVIVKPIIDLKKNIFCEGETITLSALNLPDNATVVWDMGDGKTINKKQTNYVYTNPGIYSILLNYYADKKLIHSETAQITVVANPKPDFDWTDKHENEIEENYTITFIDKSFDAVKWEWNFGDKRYSNSANPTHTYKNQGNYAVTLTVTNQYGCKDQKTQLIDVKDQNPLLAPNSFSPNGDGINDYFIPKKLENTNLNFELKILDRTGKLIYQTNDSNKPWNGRYNNTGELLNNNGTPFIWMVTITSDDGKIKRFNGTINIVN